MILNRILFTLNHIYIIPRMWDSKFIITWALGDCWTAFFEPLVPAAGPDNSDMMLSIHHKTKSPRASEDLWLIQSLAVLMTGSGIWHNGICSVQQLVRCRPKINNEQKSKALPCLNIFSARYKYNHATQAKNSSVHHHQYTETLIARIATHLAT